MNRKLFFCFVNIVFLFSILFFSVVVYADDPAPTDPPANGSEGGGEQAQPQVGWLTKIGGVVSASFVGLKKYLTEKCNEFWSDFNWLKLKFKEYYKYVHDTCINSWEGFMKIFSETNKLIQDTINKVWDYCKLVQKWCYDTYNTSLVFLQKQVDYISGCFQGLLTLISDEFSKLIHWFNDFFVNLWNKVLDFLRFCWHFLLGNLTRFLDWMVQQLFKVWCFCLSFVPDVNTGGNFAVGLGYFISFGLILDDFIPVHEAFMLFGLAIVFRAGVIVFRFLLWTIWEIIP